MRANYNRQPLSIIKGNNKEIAIFSAEGKNIDHKVVASFGEEWLKFNNFSDEAITKSAEEYFDILDDTIINKNTYGIDIGCGTGRWSKFLSQKIGFIEVVDPSNAIFAADKLLGNIENVRLTKASTETLPFDDETFDFAMSIGVLHHIPDTQQAMKDCTRKVKKGGYFYCYLYHNLESRGKWFKWLYQLSEVIRHPVQQMPPRLKRFVCDILAVVLYMPFVLLIRFTALIGFKYIASRMPLHGYANKPFFVIRNDALDKFGTSLEQRFSRAEVTEMMHNCGLEDIRISPGSPFYHAVGRKA